MRTLKQLRKAKKLTQMQLAILCDVTINTIIAWENRVGNPKPENMEKLKKALGEEEWKK